MRWPISQDYNEAIQSPEISFSDAELKHGEVVCNALGIPLPRSGNFADVYEFRCTNGTRWAIKCFTREVAGLRERYQEISRALQEAKLPFTVEFTYQQEGIRIRGQWYPILKMQWVDGLTFNDFVRQNLDKPAVLDGLLQIWGRMAQRLRAAGIAHADLQHGNVLLVPGSTATSLAVKLIDYDGMFVPALAGRPSGEVGHPSYQHPQRVREAVYTGEVDRFPLLLIAASLRCVRVGGRGLWEKYDNGDNLLFSEADLKAPDSSKLFSDLNGLTDGKAKAIVGVVRHALAGTFDKVPLLDEVMTELTSSTAVKTARPVATAPSLTAQPKLEERVGDSIVAPRESAVVTKAVSTDELAAEDAFRFDKEKPISSRRGRKSKAASGAGIPSLVWVALGLVLVLGVIGITFVMLSSKPTKSGEGPVVAAGPQTSVSAKPSFPVKESGNRPDKDPVKDAGKIPVMKDPLDPVKGSLVETGAGPKAWKCMNLSQAQVFDDFVRINRGGAINTKDAWVGPLEMTIVARTKKKSSIGIYCYQHGTGVEFNWEGDQPILLIRRPDGKPDVQWGGSVVKPEPKVKPLELDTWNKLCWRVTEKGMDVLINDEIVFSETDKKNYDLSSNARPWILGGSDPIDVKYFSIRRPGGPILAGAMGDAGTADCKPDAPMGVGK